MKKLLFLSALLTFGLSSCQEDSLISDNPPPPGDNIKISFVPFYGEEAAQMDSLYTNKAGNSFMIDTVSLLISDLQFYDINLDQTLDTARNIVMISTDKPEALVARLNGGGYYGRYTMISGVDASRVEEELQTIINQYPRFVRDDAYFHNFFQLRASVMEPDSTFSPIRYDIGGIDLADTTVSEVRSFSIDNNQQITLVVLVNLKPILDNVDLRLVDEIKSDPTNQLDFGAAQLLLDSLKFEIF